MYTRTRSPSDALLYARALAANDESKRAVGCLERSGILGGGNGDYRLHVRAALLASECLSRVGEYEEACLVVEEAFRCGQGGAVVEDGNDVGQLSLLREELGSNEEDEDDLHPLALLCCVRGKLYDQLSNPTRAASWLQAALRIDAHCVEALDYLFARHFLQPDEERELVESLDFRQPHLMNSDPYWLKDYYLAAVSVPTTTTTKTDDATNHSQKKPHESMDEHNDDHPPLKDNNNNTLSPPLKTDASSIYHHNTPSSSPQYLQPSSPHNLLFPSDKQTNNNNTTPLTRLLTTHGLSQSPQVLSLYANQAYARHHTALALRLCQTLHSLDPLHHDSLIVHCASLLALRQPRPLYSLAHALVHARPRSAVGWFAVGCYYLATRRRDAAQRHFCRATRLEPRSASAWIAFGCAFSAADETDQALASYRAARRLWGASHVPVLYMGMEYLRTNHLQLAGHFLQSAGRMNTKDPLSFNELGVCAYRLGDYAEALGLLVHALRLCVRLELEEREERELDWLLSGASGSGSESREKEYQPLDIDLDRLSDKDCIVCCQDSFWEPTIFNLGQTYRKIRQFEDAAACFEKAISLVPGNAGSYAALGYAKHLLGDVDSAIECYHQALGMKPDDTFSGEMLNRALHESFERPDPLFAVVVQQETTKESQGYGRELEAQQRRSTNGSILSTTNNTSFWLLDDSSRGRNNKSMATDESSNLSSSLDCSDIEMSMT